MLIILIKVIKLVISFVLEKSTIFYIKRTFFILLLNKKIYLLSIFLSKNNINFIFFYKNVFKLFH